MMRPGSRTGFAAVAPAHRQLIRRDVEKGSTLAVQCDGALSAPGQNTNRATAMPSEPVTVSRRDLLSLIGAVSGSAAMYHAMTALGLCLRIRIQGADQARGRSEGRFRPDPRRRACRHDGGAGAAQGRIQGADPGIQQPRRRPQLDAARRGFLHRTRRLQRRPASSSRVSTSIPARGGFPIITARCSTTASASALRSSRSSSSITTRFCIRPGRSAARPQRIRDIKTDFQGQISELLAKVTQQGKLDEAVSKEDREILMQALRSWGALDRNYAYKANLISAEFRGYAKGPGGGLGAAPIPGEPIGLSEILNSRLWRYLQNFARHSFQTTMFQPVGGMDMIGKAFAREVGDVIRYDARVTRIGQDDRGVTVTYTDLKSPATAATGQGRLVRLHHSAFDSEPAQNRRRRADEGRHRRRALFGGGQDRPAVQAPLLGGG